VTLFGFWSHPDRCGGWSRSTGLSGLPWQLFLDICSHLQRLVHRCQHFALRTAVCRSVQSLWAAWAGSIPGTKVFPLASASSSALQPPSPSPRPLGTARPQRDADYWAHLAVPALPQAPPPPPPPQCVTRTTALLYLRSMYRIIEWQKTRHVPQSNRSNSTGATPVTWPKTVRSPLRSVRVKQREVSAHISAVICQLKARAAFSKHQRQTPRLNCAVFDVSVSHNAKRSQKTERTQDWQTRCRVPPQFGCQHDRKCVLSGVHWHCSGVRHATSRGPAVSQLKHTKCFARQTPFYVNLHKRRHKRHFCCCCKWKHMLNSH
jgi:hypothetical protein